MTELRILRGVPGSGKTTYALTLTDFVHVNRDSIRFQLFGRYWNVDEVVVTDVENAMVESALRAGHDVVLDATNVNNKFVRSKLSIAARYGALVTFEDFPIPMFDAILRDSHRERTVGSDVIEGFFQRYKIDRVAGTLPPAPEPLPIFEPYVSSTNFPLAYIVDTDGTVANHEGVRSPYDTSKYHLDTVHQHMAMLVETLYADGIKILALSGRDETFRHVTEGWWQQNGIPFTEFFFRPAGDKRMDAIVKYELFKEHIEPHYNVVGAFDDRPQVIRMWETIGVPVLNVGDGREF